MTTVQTVQWPSRTPEELEAIYTRRRAEAIQQVQKLLALPPAEAAHWLAKRHIRRDVKWGASEQDIYASHAGCTSDLGAVEVSYGPKRQIEVKRIGPPNFPSWSDYPPGYDYHATFSLHSIYVELREEIEARKRPQQLTLWEVAS